MKIASWNVNSIRVRIDHVRDWLQEQQADVLGLQEIKMPEENYPANDLEEVGYHSLVNGQKTYNGVALLSREEPEDPVLPGIHAGSEAGQSKNQASLRSGRRRRDSARIRVGRSGRMLATRLLSDGC